MRDCTIFLLAVIGFALLLAAIPRHQQDWLRRKLTAGASLGLRLSGCLLLGLAFGVAGVGFGWAYGAIVWLGWLTIAAALVVAAHTNRERIIARIRR